MGTPRQRKDYDTLLLAPLTSEERHVVITGASSGIGAALARTLAAEGFFVHACARRANKLREVTDDNERAFGYACDVSDEGQVKKFVSKVRSKTPFVDGLINCAGGFGSIGPLCDTDSREWLQTLTVNVFGTYLMSKHVTPLMQRERRPAVVNFAGGGAFNAFPNYSAYAVSKAAVVRLTENMAAEVASAGLRVNAVAPGFVATDIHQATLRAGDALAGGSHYQETVRRLQSGAVPMSIPVACVRFLLSERSGDLTGKTISASFDPWDTPAFEANISRINSSDLYTLRRINLMHLMSNGLRAELETALPP
jgi:NAD(P)-dependent dehydrogenase (short-subunit alcohol dehydrogenase family)